MRKHGLDDLVTDCFHKPIFDYRNRMKTLGVTVEPDLVIDDYPDIPPEAFEAAELYARAHPLRGRPSGRPWRNAA